MPGQALPTVGNMENRMASGSDEQTRIFIARNGETIGDYSIDELRVGLNTGSILYGDFGWHDGLTDWLPLTDLLATLGDSPQADPGEDRQEGETPKQPSWRDDAATQKQIDYLKSFGVAPPTGLTKGEASDLIEKASNDPQALEYQSANRVREYENRRIEEARHPSYYLKDRVRVAAKELDATKASAAEAKKMISTATKRIAALEKKKLSESDEFELITLNNQIEDAKADIDEANATLEDHPGNLKDAQDELKNATALRSNFWKSTFKREGPVFIDSDELIDYADTIDSLYEQYGSYFKVPTNKQISDILEALDNASSEWDRAEPRSFYATLRAWFPDSQKAQARRNPKAQNAGCLVFFGALVIIYYLLRGIS